MPASWLPFFCCCNPCPHCSPGPTPFHRTITVSDVTLYPGCCGNQYRWTTPLSVDPNGVFELTRPDPAGSPCVWSRSVPAEGVWSTWDPWHGDCVGDPDSAHVVSSLAHVLTRTADGWALEIRAVEDGGDYILLFAGWTLDPVSECGPGVIPNDVLLCGYQYGATGGTASVA